MQNRQYQEFRDEQQTEMQNYQNSIPVGQPVHPHAHPYPHQAPMHHLPPFPHHPPPFHHQHPLPPQNYLPPPPPAFPPMAPAVNGQNFNYPVQLSCPCCKSTVPTVVNQQSGNTTFLWCAFIGCCVTPLCCCVPFLMDSCLDKTHYCPNCGHAILRKHQRCFEFIGC